MISHPRKHDADSTTDHGLGSLTSGRLVQADTTAILKNATNTDAEVADAVTKRHTSGGETVGGDFSGTVGNASHGSTKRCTDSKEHDRSHAMDSGSDHTGTLSAGLHGTTQLCTSCTQKTTAWAMPYLTNAIAPPTSSAWTTLVLDTDTNVDPSSSFNTSTGVFTVPVAGRYIIVASARWNNLHANESAMLRVRQGGTEIFRDARTVLYNHATTYTIATGIINAAANDAIDLRYYTDTAQADATIGAGAAATFLHIHLLGT